MEERLLLRPREAASAMGVSLSKFYALLDRKELPAVKVGASYRIPTAALRAWIEDHTSGGEDEGAAPVADGNGGVRQMDRTVT